MDIIKHGFYKTYFYYFVYRNEIDTMYIILFNITLIGFYQPQEIKLKKD